MISKLVFPRKSYTGWGSSKKLLAEVLQYGAKSILCIADKGLMELGLINKVTKPLLEEGFELDVFTHSGFEPSLQTGEDLSDYVQKGKFDLVIGIGGGSTLDLAKIASVMAVHSGEVSDYLNLTGTRQIKNKGLPKILMPTTSGSGSEVTNIAVLALESTKDVITNDNLMADIAIVDPALTVSVPKKVTAATGIDAFTHAIEAYLSVNSNPTTDALAVQAVKLIGRSLKRVVDNGEDKDGRIEMSVGSYLAGLSFFNAGVGGVHALAYPLGGQFKIAHGESNAVLLPYVLDYIRPSCENRMTHLYNILTGNSLKNEKEASNRFIHLIGKIVRDVGIPHNLREFQVPQESLELLTKDAIKQERLLARSPMSLEYKDIFKIYKSAFEG